MADQELDQEKYNKPVSGAVRRFLDQKIDSDDKTARQEIIEGAKLGSLLGIGYIIEGPSGVRRNPKNAADASFFTSVLATGCVATVFTGLALSDIGNPYVRIVDMDNPESLMATDQMSPITDGVNTDWEYSIIGDVMLVRDGADVRLLERNNETDTQGTEWRFMQDEREVLQKITEVRDRVILMDLHAQGIEIPESAIQTNLTVTTYDSFSPLHWEKKNVEQTAIGESEASLSEASAEDLSILNDFWSSAYVSAAQGDYGYGSMDIAEDLPTEFIEEDAVTFSGVATTLSIIFSPLILGGLAGGAITASNVARRNRQKRNITPKP